MSDQKQTKENETMNAAQVLVRCLENEGVEYVFGIPGEENLEVMRALKDSKIKFITVRHEQGAAFMADVYGKLKGKAGVCLATLGPGATNLVTGVADANTDGAPLIAITGQVGTERMHLTSHQYLDLVTMFTPITKRSKQVVNPDTVNEVVRIAFKYAESEKPGACHIDLPCNIAAMPVESEVGRQPLKHHKPNLEMASIESLEEAAGLLFQAKRPVILAGHSAIRNKASKALTEFAEKLHIPVINTMMVFNDCSYGLIKWKEEDRYGENFYVDFTNPDFVKFAESMHAIGYRINSAQELIPTLEKAFEQKVPVIIDCPVDYRENTKLTEHLKELIKSYQAQQPEA